MGTIGSKAALVGALVAGMLLVGCGSDDRPGASGGTGGSGGSGGIQPPAPVICGSNSCTAPEGSAAYGISACCLADNACGLQTPLSPGDCLPPGALGGLDPSCPDFFMDPISMKGCCAEDGKCGALDTANLGCIAGDKLGLADQDCVFQPDNDCTAIIDVVCDGPEDCPNGEMCCGHYAGSYDRFICASTCDEAAVTMPGTWSEICHPGQVCAIDGYQCASIDYLPDFLYRCRDTGFLLCGEPNAAMDACVEPVNSGPDEITCGDTKCGASEKCCIRLPHEPYCAPADGFCQCITDTGGNTDGGNIDSGDTDSGN